MINGNKIIKTKTINKNECEEERNNQNGVSDRKKIYNKNKKETEAK